VGGGSSVRRSACRSRNGTGPHSGEDLGKYPLRCAYYPCNASSRLCARGWHVIHRNRGVATCKNSNAAAATARKKVCSMSRQRPTSNLYQKSRVAQESPERLFLSGDNCRLLIQPWTCLSTKRSHHWLPHWLGRKVLAHYSLVTNLIRAASMLGQNQSAARWRNVHCASDKPSDACLTGWYGAIHAT
jgi:hypothetical protein